MGLMTEVGIDTGEVFAVGVGLELMEVVGCYTFVKVYFDWDYFCLDCSPFPLTYPLTSLLLLALSTSFPLFI